METLLEALTSLERDTASYSVDLKIIVASIKALIEEIQSEHDEKLEETERKAKSQVSDVQASMRQQRQSQAIEIESYGEQIASLTKEHIGFQRKADRVLGTTLKSLTDAQGIIRVLEGDLKREQAAHQAALNLGRSVLDRQMRKISDLASLVDRERHNWKVVGKQQAHGWPDRVIYECDGCPARILADEDFLR